MLTAKQLSMSAGGVYYYEDPRIRGRSLIKNKPPNEEETPDAAQNIEDVAVAQQHPSMRSLLLHPARLHVRYEAKRTS